MFDFISVKSLFLIFTKGMKPIRNLKHIFKSNCLIASRGNTFYYVLKLLVMPQLRSVSAVSTPLLSQESLTVHSR
uniref:Uncharacterized protein n=1 Tax=Anguilla anguilla TaxID=7936 RepID=A0A0E9WY24_ANGAN